MGPNAQGAVGKDATASIRIALRAAVSTNETEAKAEDTTRAERGERVALMCLAS